MEFSRNPGVKKSLSVSLIIALLEQLERIDFLASPFLNNICLSSSCKIYIAINHGRESNLCPFPWSLTHRRRFWLLEECARGEKLSMCDSGEVSSLNPTNLIIN